MTTKYFVIGSSNDCTICDCCGKQNLKKTIVLGVVDEDGNREYDPHYFGTTCAKKAVGYNSKLVDAIASAAKAKDTVRYFNKGNFKFSVVVTAPNSPSAFNVINTSNGVELATLTSKELILGTDWADKEAIAAKYW